MRTEFIRALAIAILFTVVGGCTPQPTAFPTETPERLKRLTDVTDRVVQHARSVAEGAAPSERRAAMRDAIAAVIAANQQYEEHSKAILNLQNAEALACIRAHYMDILDFETMLARRDEALQRNDEVRATRYMVFLRQMAMEAGRCAIQSTYHLVTLEKRREARNHGAILISKIYAIATVLRAATDLQVAHVLNEQVRTYERLVATLGPKHDAKFVSDALPKLRATVAILEKTQRGDPLPGQSPSGP